MAGLTIRQAVPGDTNRIAELLAGDPGRESIARAGSAERAIAFGTGIVRLTNSPQGWRHTAVAELDDRVVGIIQAGGHRGDMQLTPRLIYLAVQTFGPVGIVRLLPRLRARRRVQPQTPPGAYHIAEVDVDPALRNKGIGAALLKHAESEALATGYQLMSLTTTTVNPARRLYERHGFRVIATRTDPAYKRYTGIEGRHLMVKDLARSHACTGGSPRC